MADFLTRLSQRVLGSADLLQPSTPSVFTPGSVQAGGLEAEPPVLESARDAGLSIDRQPSRAATAAASPLINSGDPVHGAARFDSNESGRRPVAPTVAAPSIGRSLHAPDNRVQRRTGNEAGSAGDMKGDKGDAAMQGTQHVAPHVITPRSVGPSDTDSGFSPTGHRRADLAEPVAEAAYGGNNRRQDRAPRHEQSRSVADEAFDPPRLLVPPEILANEENAGNEQPVLSNASDVVRSGLVDSIPAGISRESPDRPALRERRAIEPLLMPTPRAVKPQPVEAAPTPVQPAPTIQVSIGRIDIRATYPAPTERQRPTPQQPSLTLDAYLRQHNGRRS